MKMIQLTVTETLTKEAAEQKINQSAKHLIENQQGADIADLISVVIARAIPQIQDTDEQNQIYQMLVNASAGGLAAEARLSSALKRIDDLNRVIERSLEQKTCSPEPLAMPDEEESDHTIELESEANASEGEEEKARD
ncbi:hypothetical protein [Vibrio owensii]|uniref:hypothetical protein n=1 Tax=Vibrio owensii TaxID=696485 RepID=UPI003CE53BDA